MSTHVSLRGIAARTISRSCFNQEEDFPATSKQMTDHRPEGSVSTAPAGNAGDLWARLRCQSVHHPLFWCHSITASNLKHNDVHGKGNPPTPSHTHKRTHTQYRERNFDLLARFPPLCDLLPIFPKTAESGSLRGSRPHSPLSLLLPGYQ